MLEQSDEVKDIGLNITTISIVVLVPGGLLYSGDVSADFLPSIG